MSRFARWIALLIALGGCSAAFAQNIAVNGWCDLGATSAAVSGLNSTNRLQGDIPNCTVTVYFTGTTTLATIYANVGGTPKSNPFTATTKGQYLFYVLAGTGYDVVLSGGVSPNTYPSPVTLTDIPQGQGSGGTRFPQQGWGASLAAPQGVSDTTLTVGSSAGIPSSGTFFIDSEYETYTGISGNVLTGITRGVAGTTPASHTSTNVISVNIPFSPLTQAQFGGVYGATGSTGGTQHGVLAANCPNPTVGLNLVAIVDVFQANCGGNATFIDSAGGIHQYNSSATDFLAPLIVYPNLPSGNGVNSLPLKITNTNLVVQTDGAYQFHQPIGFGSFLYGPVRALPVPNIGTPTLVGAVTGGSCNITYEVAGVDADGNTIPGGTVTATGLTFPGLGLAIIQTAQVAGVATYNIWRTAVSGCGGTVTAGKFTPSTTALYPVFQDVGGVGDGTSPPASNTSIAKSCVGTAANPELFCTLAGASGTPSVSCGGSTQGWNWHNTAATTSPFALVCNGTSWVTAF